MSEDQVRMLKNLDKVLFDDAGETPGEVRQRLEAEGGDVKGLITRVKSAAGKAYRQALAEEAKRAHTQAEHSKGSVFGSLVGIGRDKLIELIRAAATGRYGPVAMARCRNQDSEKLSEDDL